MHSLTLSARLRNGRRPVPLALKVSPAISMINMNRDFLILRVLYTQYTPEEGSCTNGLIQQIIVPCNVDCCNGNRGNCCLLGCSVECMVYSLATMHSVMAHMQACFSHSTDSRQECLYRESPLCSEIPPTPSTAFPHVISSSKKWKKACFPGPEGLLGCRRSRQLEIS